MRLLDQRMHDLESAASQEKQSLQQRISKIEDPHFNGGTMPTTRYAPCNTTGGRDFTLVLGGFPRDIPREIIEEFGRRIMTKCSTWAHAGKPPRCHRQLFHLHRPRLHLLLQGMFECSPLGC